MQPDDLASAIGVDGHSDYCGDRDDAAALALLQLRPDSMAEDSA
jgi:hypothetical protein